MITFVLLPEHRWLIECNDIKGPAVDITQCAFWPNMESPELVADICEVTISITPGMSGNPFV